MVIDCMLISTLEHLDCRFDRKDLVVLAICSVFGGWYVFQKVSDYIFTKKHTSSLARL